MVKQICLQSSNTVSCLLNLYQKRSIFVVWGIVQFSFVPIITDEATFPQILMTYSTVCKSTCQDEQFSIYPYCNVLSGKSKREQLLYLHPIYLLITSFPISFPPSFLLSLLLLPSILSLSFAHNPYLSPSYSLLSAAYHCVGSDLFLVTSLPSCPLSIPLVCAASCALSFFWSISQFINFCVGMWSASQVGEPSPSNSFLKICLPIWETSHPMPARSVCVCVRAPSLLLSHCVSLYYCVTKITISLCPSTLHSVCVFMATVSVKMYMCLLVHECMI